VAGSILVAAKDVGVRPEAPVDQDVDLDTRYWTVRLLAVLRDPGGDQANDMPPLVVLLVVRSDP